MGIIEQQDKLTELDKELVKAQKYVDKLNLERKNLRLTDEDSPESS